VELIVIKGAFGDCDFVEKKCDFKPNRRKKPFENCDLKMQKNAYSNRRQCGAFLKTQYFKRLTCDFKGQTVILPNA